MWAPLFLGVAAREMSNLNPRTCLRDSLDADDGCKKKLDSSIPLAQVLTISINIEWLEFVLFITTLGLIYIGKDSLFYLAALQKCCTAQEQVLKESMSLS